MTKQIRIVRFPVNGEPTVVNIDNTLPAMQAEVGGYVEYIRLGDVLLVCDEEGSLKGKPVNPHIVSRPIVGDAFVTRVRNGQHVDLTQADLKKLKVA